MASSFNKTIIIGRVSSDVVFKKGEDGRADKAAFVISNSTVVDGEEKVDFHDICAFGKQAVLCRDYISKGDLCCIDGRLETLDRDDGKTVYRSKAIIAERITFLSCGKRKNDNQNETASKDE